MRKNYGKNQFGRWISIFGSATVLAAGVGALIYLVSSFSNASKSDESRKGEDSVSVSRCIVITESFADSDEMDWNRLLDEDVVLLVPPLVSFPLENFKVIHCGTMTGLWSCVKHLRKDRLLLKPDELEGSMPEDVPRYVKEIVAINSFQDIKAHQA